MIWLSSGYCKSLYPSHVSKTGFFDLQRGTLDYKTSSVFSAVLISTTITLLSTVQFRSSSSSKIAADVLALEICFS
jgi:hypothetical protein